MQAYKLIFEPYTDDVNAWRVPARRRFDMLWQTTHNPQWKGGDIRHIAALLDAVEGCANKVEKEVKDNAGTVVGSNDVYNLKPEGTELLLSRAEYDLAKNAWKSFQPLLSNATARDQLDYEAWLDGAEVVTVEPVVKALN